METKFCKICGELKPISEFHKSQNTLLCKFHYNQRGRENKKKYRQDQKNKKKEKLKYQERKIRLWANLLVSNTKKRNCENTLTVDDVIQLYDSQNRLCFWFKIPLKPSLTKKHPQQPSIDRLDRTKGYTKDNVVLCCYAANIGRNETELNVWNDFISLLVDKKEMTCSDDNLRKLYTDIEDTNDKDTYVIYDLGLNYVLTKNLKKFAKENNINYNTLMSYRKKLKRTPQTGYIILNRSKNEKVTKRIYHLESPNKERFKLFSLRDFCIKNKLNDSALQRVAKGELKHFKGWKCEYETIVLQ